MRVSLGTVFEAPLDSVLAELRRPALLMHVAAPMVAFRAIDPPRLPESWTAGCYVVGLKLFGWLPFGKQSVVIEFPASTADHVTLRDNGCSDVATRWDHLITLRRRADGRTDYRDDIEIAAGLLTPLVWAFAAVFYRHRQRRWRRLVARGFVYD